jgi:hypothetical protein
MESTMSQDKGFESVIKANDRVTVLHAYQALVEIVHSFREPFLDLVDLWSSYYSSGRTLEDLLAENPGSWLWWSDAVSRAQAQPELERNASNTQGRLIVPLGVESRLNVTDEISAIEAYDSVIRLLEDYDSRRDVHELLPAFRYRELIGGVPNSTFGWYAFSICLESVRRKTGVD